MALPDYFKAEQGTLVSWRPSGGDAVIGVSGLANGSARMGASVDLGSAWDQNYVIRIVKEFATAPAAGETVEAYLAFSDDDSVFPAGVSGSDAAWPADGNEDEWAKQLGVPAAWLVCTNDATTTVQVGPWFVVRPSARYVAPVEDNNSGVAFHTTAANLRLDFMPKRLLAQDAA